MTKPELNDTDLDALFGSHKDVDTEPSPDFMARILRDAADAVAIPTPPSTLDRFQTWLRQWGGISGGMVAASLTGLWFGVAMPIDSFDPTRLLVIAETTELEDMDQGWFAPGGGAWSVLEDG